MEADGNIQQPDKSWKQSVGVRPETLVYVPMIILVSTGSIMLEWYFHDSNSVFLTRITFFIAILGFLCNIIVLFYFLAIIEALKIQSSLWMNVTCTYLIKSLVMIYSATGDLMESFSDTEVKCRFRYGLPLAAETACISSFLMLIVERTAALHFPTFYCFVPKLALVMHLYCWSYAVSFLLFIVFQIQDYDCPIRCQSPYTNMTPVCPVLPFTLCVMGLLIIVTLSSVMFLYPANYGKAEKIRLQMEMNGTYVVIAFGSAVTVLGMPWQIVQLLFWIEKLDLAEYTIIMRFSRMVLDTTVIIPFLAIMTTFEFRFLMNNCFKISSLSIVKKKIVAKENYKHAIRKLVEVERKVRRNKNRCRFASISNRTNSLGNALPSLDFIPAKTSSELHARKEFMFV